MSTHSICRSVLFLGLLLPILGGCSTPSTDGEITRIVRHQASEMEQLSHVGNVWISEQPTESDLVWMRDNAVSMVIDVRGRDEDRGFDERAYVVSLGMRYQTAPLEVDQDFVIRYFEFTRNILRNRKDIPTLIHCGTANRAAAVWMVYRVLDENVSYATALAEAEIAGLNNPRTLTLVQQYLLSNGVKGDFTAGLAGAAPMTATDGPDEVIYNSSDNRRD